MGKYHWVRQVEDPECAEGGFSVRNRDRNISPDELLRRERLPVCTVLDNVRSAYNVGSIFRTSDSVRVQKLYLCGMTAFPPNEKLSKTSLGTVDYVPWEYHRDTGTVIRELKKQGICIACLETTDRSNDFFEFQFPSPVCLVLGHEIEGVSPSIIREADAVLEVPTMGVKNSLNVATLFGIVVYEILRQFRGKGIMKRQQ